MADCEFNATGFSSFSGLGRFWRIAKRDELIANQWQRSDTRYFANILTVQTEPFVCPGRMPSATNPVNLR